MKKIIFLSFLICSVLTVYSQEIIKESPTEITIPKDDIRLLERDLQPPDPMRPELHFDNPYYRDPLDNPFPTGFQNTLMMTLMNNLTFTVTGDSEVWPGITTINTAMFDLKYDTDLWHLSAGTTFWKYDGARRPYADVVFHTDASITPLNWLTVGVHGQYSTMSKSNYKRWSILPETMIPYTKFTGYSEIMLNDNFGIHGEVGGQYNPMKKKWEPTYFIGPTFNLFRKKK